MATDLSMQTPTYVRTLLGYQRPKIMSVVAEAVRVSMVVCEGRERWASPDPNGDHLGGVLC